MRNLLGHIIDEAEEWLRKTFTDKICSVIVFGSAVRGWREKPEDVDILIVVDVPREEALKAKQIFVESGVDLKLSEKYGLYPELIVLSKERLVADQRAFIIALFMMEYLFTEKKTYLLKR